jgi:exosortase
LSWRAIEATFRLASSNDAYTYLLLILPLSVGMIYTQREEVIVRDESNRALGAAALATALLAIGVLAWPLNLSDDARLSGTIFALVLWWIGGVIFCFGLRTFKAFLFPLCFLFLIVPLPHAVVSRIIEFLQYWSAVAAEIMFRAAGVDVVRDGLVLSIPGLNIEVAPECSSIRTSELLVVTGIILAQLFLRSWWRKILLVTAAIPLSIAKNGFRIFVIALLGTRVDSGFLDGRLHHHGGILFYGVALVSMIALLVLLRRTEPCGEDGSYRFGTGIEGHMS